MSPSCNQTSDETIAPRGRRRWVKVDVDEDLFAQLHIRAAESRMRMQAYLRRCLKDTKSYAGHDGPERMFSGPDLKAQ